jgi:hypothetical protein
LNKHDSKIPEPAEDDRSMKQGTRNEFLFRLYQWRLNLRTKNV